MKTLLRIIALAGALTLAVSLRAQTGTAPKSVIHVVTVDVSSQEIFLSSTLSADRGQTVSDWADCKRGTSGCAMRSAMSSAAKSANGTRA